jgi:DNA-binding XRE family transcriptional regulator
MKPDGVDEKRQQRARLRDELYRRVAANEIGLPDAVRLMRRIADKTQDEYARLVGVSPRILKELERGVGNPTLETIRKVLAPFGLDVGVRRRPKESGSV